jgi:hypothetical protein
MIEYSRGSSSVQGRAGWVIAQIGRSFEPIVVGGVPCRLSGGILFRCACLVSIP